MQSVTPLSIRISEILNRLNQGEVLLIDDLIEEFQVSKRTIQRDIHQKLSFLPYEQNGQKIWLDPIHLGQFHAEHIQNLAKNMNWQQFFPKWDLKQMKEGVSGNVPWSIMPFEAEKVTPTMQQNMGELKKAISHHLQIRFQYQSKHYECQPYRLMNFKGMWYVAAVDISVKKLKTFRLSKIKLLGLTQSVFSLNSTIQLEIESSDTVWIGSGDVIEAKILVKPEFAVQFEQRKIFPQQKIERIMQDGGLLISSQVRHLREILPTIQYWLPYIEVVSPNNLKRALLLNLKASIKMLKEDT